MNYFVSIMKTIDKEKDQEIRAEHLDYLNALIKSGKILAKGPFTDGSGGLIILNVDSYEEAKQLIEADPVIRDKTREMVLLEWKSNLGERKA